MTARTGIARVSSRFCLTPGTACTLNAVAVTVWGLAGIVTKDVLGAGVGALEVAFWRLLLSSLLFALHAGCQGTLKLQAKADLGYFAGFAVFVMGLNYVSFNVAIAASGVSLTLLVLAAVPGLIAVASWRLFGERLTPATLSLAGLSGVGMVLATWGGGRGIHVSITGLSFAIVAALTVAAYALASKALLQRYTPVSLYAFVMPLAALALLPFVSFSAKPLHVWLDLAVLALLPSYAAHLLYGVSLKHLELSRVGLLGNLEPVVGLLSAALLFGERFSVIGSLGVLLVLGVSGLAASSRISPQTKEPRPNRALGRCIKATSDQSRGTGFPS